MLNQKILALLGLSFALSAVPALADSAPPAPTQIEQKSDIKERKDTLAAQQAIDKANDDAIEATRQATEDQRLEELQRSKDQDRRDRDIAERAAQDVRDKRHQDSLNYNKPH